MNQRLPTTTLEEEEQAAAAAMAQTSVESRPAETDDATEEGITSGHMRQSALLAFGGVFFAVFLAFLDCVRRKKVLHVVLKRALGIDLDQKERERKEEEERKKSDANNEVGFELLKLIEAMGTEAKTKAEEKAEEGEKVDEMKVIGDDEEKSDLAIPQPQGTKAEVRE